MIDFKNIGEAAVHAWHTPGTDIDKANELAGRAAVAAMIPAECESDCFLGCPFCGHDGECTISANDGNKPGPSCPASKEARP